MTVQLQKATQYQATTEARQQQADVVTYNCCLHTLIPSPVIITRATTPYR